jgi:hypothetical protein
MRDLLRRLEKLEECAKAQIVPADCICRDNPVKLVALEPGQPLPSVPDCPAHPDRIRLIVMRGMEAPGVVARQFVEGIEYRDQDNA